MVAEICGMVWYGTSLAKRVWVLLFSGGGGGGSGSSLIYCLLEIFTIS
jgi:hypothetical protein